MVEVGGAPVLLGDGGQVGVGARQVAALLRAEAAVVLDHAVKVVLADLGAPATTE